MIEIQSSDLMLSYLKNLVKEKQKDLFLIIFIILLVLASFAFGWLANNSETSKIIIQSQQATGTTGGFPKSADTVKKGVYAKEKQEKRLTASKNSDKYHNPECPWAKKISPENRIWFNSEKEASSAGYRPCSYFDRYKNKE